MLTICHVRGDRRGEWREITIDQAIGLGEQMKCPRCEGRVTPFKRSRNGARAHFEHVEGHTGCPHSRSLKGPYSGHPSRHPDPVEW